MSNREQGRQKQPSAKGFRPARRMFVISVTRDGVPGNLQAIGKADCRLARVSRTNRAVVSTQARLPAHAGIMRRDPFFLLQIPLC
jgi:hypothetical protein